MISRGSTSGDPNQPRKCHSQEECMAITQLEALTGLVLGFDLNDLEGVFTRHSDALVLQDTIANFDIDRVFVDTCSSVDILYWSALEQMDIKIEDLQPMATSLFGFLGHEVQPLDQIKLSLSLGTELRRKTLLATFMVVGTPPPTMLSWVTRSSIVCKLWLPLIIRRSNFL